MGKIKVHELAKELGMQSKELVDKLINMQYDVKNHMSSLDDSDAEKIRKHFKGEKENIADSAKKNKKVPVSPVIIRREVTRIETTEPAVKKDVRRQDDGLGVVQRRSDISMNIKYRTPPRKIGSITPNKVNQKTVVAPKTETMVQKNVETVKSKTSKDNDKLVKNVETNIKKDEAMNKAPANNLSEEKKNVTETKTTVVNQFTKVSDDNITKKNVETKQNKVKVEETKQVMREEKKEFKKENREYNNFNKNKTSFDSRKPYNKDGNREEFNSGKRFDNQNKDGNKRFDNNGRKFENNNGKKFDGQNRNFDSNKKGFQKNGNGGNRVEKEIQGILASSEAEDQKEQARESVRTAYKDKEKDNRKFEESSKKNSKNKNNRSSREEINMGKLKDLQSEDKLSHMFNDTDSKMFDYYDLSKGSKAFKKNKKKPMESKEHIEQKIFELTDIEIGDTITVKDLAEKLKKQASEVIKKLMGYGIMATLNNELDFDTAFLVASEFGVTAKKKEVVSDEDILFDDSDDKEEDLVPRPPIVVVMGHVDHGKTSLLDAIRSTNVIEREAGGITQHIGACKVEINGRAITFLDTPGHEAFTAMRARGAQVTDIAIIIVAADDGIMPQTVEAINHAKAAGVSIIVAINKIDKEGANIDRVKQELTEYGLVPEEWGGDTICVPISAKQHKNIDSLLEMVLLVADMKDLKTNPNKQSKGTVLEARLDKNTGITASLLVQRGTLNIGDTIVVGSVIGKIRGMVNDKGQKVNTAGPSTPVEVIGLPEVPTAGETFYEVENEKVAKHLIEKRKSKEREDMIRRNAPVTLDNLFNQIEEGKLKDLNIIIKADVQGSAQAIRQSLEKIQNDEARVRIIHCNDGGITESDVTLAKVTNSIIIGFNVRPEPMAKSIADKENVDIKIYSVIYNAIDDVTAALKGMRKPKYKEVIQGTAEVRQVFKITNVGIIAGCYVTDGKIVRNSGLRVIRDNVVIHTGKLSSLKRMKDDAKDVAAGYECGVQIENYDDIKVGDVLESYIMEEIKQD